MQIKVWVNVISFHAYADISFESSSDVSISSPIYWHLEIHSEREELLFGPKSIVFQEWNWGNYSFDFNWLLNY